MRAIRSSRLAPFGAILGSLLACALHTCSANAETIADARYESPVERYGHFALGRPHEYAALRATTDAGRSVVLRLDADEVFEDLVPRRVRISRGAPVELLAIVSRRDDGSRLVLVRLDRDRLVISAESPPIGTPKRWMNPVAVADLDGDGQAEIAAVTTPHIGGVLRVYRREGRRLVEIDALTGFSNHVLGTTELGLSTSAIIDGRAHLIVPDTQRLRLRLLVMRAGRLAEVGRCTPSSVVTGPVRQVSGSTLSVGLDSGSWTIDARTCAPP